MYAQRLMVVAMMLTVTMMLPEHLVCEGVWWLAQGDSAACKAEL